MQAHRAKVTLEHVQRLDVGIRGSVTLEGLHLRCACASDTNASGGRQAGRPKQASKGALEVGAYQAVKAGVVTSLIEDRLKQALHCGVRQRSSQCRAGTNDGSRGGTEDGRNVARSRSPRAGIADPGLRARGAVGSGLVASVKLGNLIRGHRNFHVTLDPSDRLCHVVSQFITHASNISDVLSELGNTNCAPVNLGVVGKFRAIANNVVADASREVYVQAVRGATNLGGRKAIGLPAEVHVAGLGALLCHRREGRVLGVNQGNHVHQIFALTAAGEVGFS